MTTIYRCPLSETIDVEAVAKQSKSNNNKPTQCSSTLFLFYSSHRRLAASAAVVVAQRTPNYHHRCCGSWLGNESLHWPPNSPPLENRLLSLKHLTSSVKVRNSGCRFMVFFEKPEVEPPNQCPSYLFEVPLFSNSSSSLSSSVFVVYDQTTPTSIQIIC